MNPKVQDVMTLMLATANDDATPDAVQTWLLGLCARLEDSATPDERFVKGTEIPPTVGAQADEYAVVRAERLRIEKEAKSVKERETELYNCIMSTLDESPDNGGVGGFYTVQRVEKDKANAKDWQQIFAWIAEQQAWELLGKSLNQKAVMEQIEDGVQIPGVEVAPIATLSFTKNK